MTPYIPLYPEWASASLSSVPPQLSAPTRSFRHLSWYTNIQTFTAPRAMQPGRAARVSCFGSACSGCSTASHHAAGDPEEIVRPRGEKAILSLAFSPDGQLIATGDGNPTKPWETRTVRKLFLRDAPVVEVNACLCD